MKSLLAIIALAAHCLIGVKSLVYPLDDEKLDPQYALIPCLPRPMYTYDDSPFRLFASRDSYVHLEANVKSAFETETFDKIFFVLFSADTDMELPDEFLYGYRYALVDEITPQLCEGTGPIDSASISSGITSLQRLPVLKTQTDDQVTLKALLDVKRSGYQYAFLINCKDENQAPLEITEGSFTFKNPHGFLPGGWYLKLPFSFLLSLGYIGTLLMYLLRCAIFRTEVMYVQYGVVIVLVMGLLEQIAYYLTFMVMNSYGDLPCCPVRNDVGFCMVLSASKRAVLVIFLLAVSLGYGIQRATLSKKEYTAVFTVGFLYLFAAVNYEVAIIAEIDSMNGNDAQPVPFSSVISSLLLSGLNILAVTWIYFSIVHVIEELEKDKQTAKRKMYEKLAKALVLWFVVGFFAEILFYTWLTDSVSTPWKYDMVPKFIWDALFLTVVFQISWLWLPSATTSQYAYAHQIPLDEDFEDDEFDPDDGDEHYEGYSDREIEFNKIRQNDMDEDELDRLGEDSDDN